MFSLVRPFLWAGRSYAASLPHLIEGNAAKNSATSGARNTVFLPNFVARSLPEFTALYREVLPKGRAASRSFTEYAGLLRLKSDVNM